MSCSTGDSSQGHESPGTSNGKQLLSPCNQSKSCVFESCRCETEPPAQTETVTSLKDESSSLKTKLERVESADVTSGTQLLPVESSSSCCRICQDSTDNTEPLSRSHCHCKGQLSRVHYSCLTEWVRYKGSNRCEICGGVFREVPSPTLGLGVNQIDALDELREQLANYQPLSRRKRSTIGGILVFMTVVTAVTGVLAVAADREFKSINDDPFATSEELQKAHIIFSMCLSFLFFCLTLTIGVLLLWFVLELYFYVQRRRLMSNATRRVLREARRHSAAFRSSVV